MIVGFLRALAPAAGHIIVHGESYHGYGVGSEGLVANAVALCGFSTEQAGVNAAVVCGDSMADVDCKRCIAKAHGLLNTTIDGRTTTEVFPADAEAHGNVFPIVKVK